MRNFLTEPIKMPLWWVALVCILLLGHFIIAVIGWIA